MLWDILGIAVVEFIEDQTARREHFHLHNSAGLFFWLSIEIEHRAFNAMRRIALLDFDRTLFPTPHVALLKHNDLQEHGKKTRKLVGILESSGYSVAILTAASANWLISQAGFWEG